MFSGREVEHIRLKQRKVHNKIGNKGDPNRIYLFQLADSMLREAHPRHSSQGGDNGLMLALNRLDFVGGVII